jgi:hypothetical protein
LAGIKRGAAGSAGGGGDVVTEEFDTVTSELLAHDIVFEAVFPGRLILVGGREALFVGRDDEEVGESAVELHVVITSTVGYSV